MCVTILDTAGHAICSAEVTVGPDGRLFLALSPADRGLLVEHYFLRGRRRVLLSGDESIMPCDLRTAWGGRQRLWWLVPLPAMPLTAGPGTLSA